MSTSRVLGLFVVLAALSAGCGPVPQNGEDVWNDATEKIKISIDSVEKADPAAIRNVVSDVVDLSDWSRVSVLESNNTLYLALHHQDQYGLSFMQVHHDGLYRITQIDSDAFWPSFSNYNNYYASCPDPNVETFWSTAWPEIPTALEAIENNHSVAEERGYVSHKALAEAENLENIYNYLSCPKLKVWGRVGHGFTHGIMVANEQMFTDFQNIKINNGLYFNSCLVHNEPFESVAMEAGAKWFIAGDRICIIGKSEKMFQCWWKKAKDQMNVCDAKLQCEIEADYPKRNFGCSGPEQLVAPPGSTGLNCGESIRISANQGEWRHYYIDCGGRTKINLYGGYGDPDMYVKVGRQPTQTDYDCKSERPWTRERCRLPSASGRVYISIYAYSSYHDVKIKARCVAPAPTPEPTPYPEPYKLEVGEAHEVIRQNEGNPYMTILDVRTSEEFAVGHLENAVNMDFNAPDFFDRIAELEKIQKYIIYCRTDNRSQATVEKMIELKFPDARYIKGGITAWIEAGYPVVQ